MSSTIASSSEETRYIRVRARLAGTTPSYRRRPRLAPLLLPMATILLVAAWLLWGLDRWADAGLRQVAGRIPATAARSREIIGAWRGIADMLGESPVLPEDDAISMASTQYALDRFRWWSPGGPAAAPANDGAPAAMPEAQPPQAQPPPVVAFPGPVPVTVTAAPKREPAPRPIEVVAVPTLPGEQPIAGVADPAASFKLSLPEHKAVASGEGAVTPVKAAPPPAPKRAMPTPPAKRAPERVRTAPRRPPVATKSGDAGPPGWADNVTRRQEAP